MLAAVPWREEAVVDDVGGVCVTFVLLTHYVLFRSVIMLGTFSSFVGRRRLLADVL